MDAIDETHHQVFDPVFIEVPPGEDFQLIQPVARQIEYHEVVGGLAGLTWP